MENTRKKPISLWWIIIALILLDYMVDEVVLNESFLVHLTKIFNLFGLKAIFIIPTLLLVVFLAIPFFYKPKGIMEYVQYFEEKVQNKFIVCLIVFFGLFYLAPKTNDYRNITHIVYPYQENNQDYVCSYNIKTQDFENKNDSNKCETALVDRIKKLQKEIKRTDNTNNFLHLVIDYARQGKIEFFSYAENDMEWENDIYVKDPKDFSWLIIKSLRKDKE